MATVTRPCWALWVVLCCAAGCEARMPPGGYDSRLLRESGTATDAAGAVEAGMQGEASLDAAAADPSQLDAAAAMPTDRLEDLTGLYATRWTLRGELVNGSQRVGAEIYFVGLMHALQSAQGPLEVQHRPCFVRMNDDSDLVTFHLQPDVPTTSEPRAAPLERVSPGVWSRPLLRIPLGFRAGDTHSSLPLNKFDQRVFDADGDQSPGVTVRSEVSVLLLGSQTCHLASVFDVRLGFELIGTGRGLMGGAVVDRGSEHRTLEKRGECPEQVSASLQSNNHTLELSRLPVDASFACEAYTMDALEQQVAAQ